MKSRHQALHFALLSCKCDKHDDKAGHKKQKRSKAKQQFYNEVKRSLSYE